MENGNPYKAPDSVVLDQLPEPEIPEAVLKKIKTAYQAAAVSGVFTLIVTLVAIYGTAMPGFSAWSMFDVVLVFGLAYGIYRKSRACAVIMLLYFIASKLFQMSQTGHAAGLPLALVFVYFFWQGIAGTYAYHRLAAAAAQARAPGAAAG
jgi:serine/threonine-protein kinase